MNQQSMSEQKKRKMRLLSNIEQRALEKGAKEAHQQDILGLLENRFNTLPDTLVEKINQIEDLAQLKQLLLETIKVNSVAEFEQLVNDSLESQKE
jgi:hypothetical protein